MTGTALTISESDEYVEANAFIQKLRNEGIVVDLASICPYAKEKVMQYVQQSDKYLVVYIEDKNRYGVTTDRVRDFAEVYDISKKDEIESIVHIQKKLIEAQPP
jgi:pyruvate/2-oxoglutarate/acetoin dehydrogenase E1 component